MPDDMIDCLIIGGGPAGLTTAIYLARFHLSVRVIDAGDGRAITIPCSHNHAGFPEGIAGSELISRMIDQAQRYGAIIDRGRVTRLDKTETGFAVEWGEGDPSPSLGAAQYFSTSSTSSCPSRCGARNFSQAGNHTS